jgi:hypothetical protein
LLSAESAVREGTVDVWVIQDYDAEIWSFKRRINLSRVKPLSQWEPTVPRFPIMAVLNDDPVPSYACATL